MLTHLGKYAPQAIALFLAVTVYSLGFLDFLENGLAEVRFKMLEREPKADLVLIEIDSPSLQELNTWPWPRSYHAAVIETLLAAGARRIALDIDFSSRSTPEEDRTLERALAGADGRVILPAFMQAVTGHGIDRQMALTSPLPRFRQHALLGSVNVVADTDGRVRRMSQSAPWGETTLPSLFAQLAGPPNREPQSFYLDFAIRPDEIPRISYADVLRGRFDPELIADRNVIIGATAIELGDKIQVPVHGVLPGAVVQSLAYESLIQDRAIRRLATGPIVILTLCIVLLFASRFSSWSWRRGLLFVGCSWFVIFLLSVLVQAVVPVTLDTTPWSLALALTYGIALLQRFDRQDMHLLAQGLAIRRKDAFMRRVVECTFDGIVTFDPNGIVKSFNSAAEEIFHCPAKDAVGSSLQRFVTLSNSSDGYSGATSLAQIRSGPFEVIGKRDAEQTFFPLQIAISEMILDDERFFIVVLRDITERKWAEDALKSSEQAAQERIIQLEAARRTLEKQGAELVRVAEDLTVAHDRAEAASRTKSEFLAAMSHELRTPLNAIIGFSEIMKDETFGPLGSQQYLNYAGDIYNSGDHLLSLINDILDLSKIEFGAEELYEENIEIPGLLQSVWVLVNQRAEKGGIELEPHSPGELPLLRADPRKLKQILVNLLDNAIKFTDPGGKVVLRAWFRLDSGFLFEVADTGIGMRPEDIPKALSQFGQVDSALERKYEGTGLGLTLSKSLVELHGGSLDLRSEVGVGTTVTVRFPAARAATPDHRPGRSIKLTRTPACSADL